MSTPRCLRLAIEACRPCKSSALRLRPSTQLRRFSSTPQSLKDVDVTAGFPSPRVESQTGVAAEGSPKVEVVAEPSPKMDTPTTATTRSAAGRESKDISEKPQKKKARKTAKGLAKTAPEAPSIPQAIAQSSPELEQADQEAPPRPFAPNVLAAYRAPMKYPAEHRIPVGSLQLRSYSVRNLEFFADFAMRAAFYLKLPASGPVPLPKIVERWTMPRSNFVHKKSQENFERITLRRLITVMDGDKSVVETWLAFLRKWQFYGVGMKANVWEFEGLDVAGKMDKQVEEVEKELDEKLANFGFNKSVAKDRSLRVLMERQGAKQVSVPMADVREASTTADQRILAGKA